MSLHVPTRHERIIDMYVSLWGYSDSAEEDKKEVRDWLERAPLLDVLKFASELVAQYKHHSLLGLIDNMEEEPDDRMSGRAVWRRDLIATLTDLRHLRDRVRHN